MNKELTDRLKHDYGKVSVIMPTKSRYKFLPLALRKFDSQTYPNKELILVDSSFEPIPEGFDFGPNVTYFRIDPKTSLGEARNTACKFATGEIIAHFDDDDYYEPTYLESTVYTLLCQDQIQLVGFHSWYYYDTINELGYYYTHPRRPYATGATMVYYREYWKTHPFPDISQGEDRRFSNAAWAEGVLFSSGGGHDFIARIHADNSNITPSIAANHKDFRPTVLPQSFMYGGVPC